MTTATPSAHPVLPASLAQRYEIERELGRGATSVVYLARDGFSGRQVALKLANAQILKGDAQLALIRKAWLNEIHLAGALKHPYIVEIYDAGFGDDAAYLAMEYLPNGTLEAYTRPDRLKPLSEVLEIIYKAASALDYACRAGIVHRDIKPANLQYIGHGQAKVGDFGAAYWSASDSETQVMNIGSLAYMAPELFRQWVTPQADIYALGVVLYELLCGHRPIEAPDQAALTYKILNGVRVPLRDYRPDLPANLEILLDRMLARSLEDRFANWPAVLQALSEHCAEATRLEVEQARQARPSESALYDQLRALPLLKSLNDAEVWELLRISTWRHVPAGTVFMREGAEAKSCYLLLKGDARVVREHKTIALVEPGTLFGELAFAEDPPLPRVATVVSSTDATIGKWSYHRLRSTSPGLQSNMMEIFFRLTAARLKQSADQYLRLYRQHTATLP